MKLPLIYLFIFLFSNSFLYSIAVSENHLWMIGTGTGGTPPLVKVDKNTGETVDSWDSSDGITTALTGISVDPDFVWVCGSTGSTYHLHRINRQTGALDWTVSLPGKPGGVAADNNQIWVTDQTNDSVYRMSKISGTILNTIPTGDNPIGVAASSGYVIVANYGGDSITHITKSDLSRKTIDVGEGPIGVAITPSMETDGYRYAFITHFDSAHDIDESEVTNFVGSVAKFREDGTMSFYDNKILVEDDIADPTFASTMRYPYAITTDGKYVWISPKNANNRSIAVMDVITMNIIDFICCGNDVMYALSRDPDGTLYSAVNELTDGDGGLFKVTNGDGETVDNVVNRRSGLGDMTGQAYDDFFGTAPINHFSADQGAVAKGKTKSKHKAWGVNDGGTFNKTKLKKNKKGKIKITLSSPQTINKIYLRIKITKANRPVNLKMVLQYKDENNKWISSDPIEDTYFVDQWITLGTSLNVTATKFRIKFTNKKADSTGKRGKFAIEEIEAFS